MATVAGEVPSFFPLQSLLCLIQLTSPQALAFGYFETLLRLGNASKILQEATRFRDFEVLLHAVGIPSLYEDFIQPTAELLEEQASTLPNHDGGAVLLDIFNDEQRSSQLTYSFKVGLVSNCRAKPLIQLCSCEPAHHQCMDEVECRVLRGLFTRHGRPHLLYEKH